MRLGLWMLLVLAILSLHAKAAAPPVARPPGKLSSEQRARLGELEPRIEAHVAAGRFAEAARLQRQVAEIYEAGYGREGFLAVSMREEVERWQRLAKVPEKARREVGRGFTAHRRAASLLWQQQRYEESEKAYREALAIWREHLGDGHLQTATGYTDLAVCLDRQGRYADALPLHERALAICREAAGEKHHLTGRAYNSVASCLLRQEKFAQAAPLFEKALAILVESVGRKDYFAAATRDNLAGCLRQQGKHEQALRHHLEALAVFREIQGEYAPATAVCYNVTALCLFEQGKLTEAMALYGKALAGFLLSFGEHHPDTAAGYVNLAHCLFEQGKYAQALSLYQTALRIERQRLGPDHNDLYSLYGQVASCLLEQGKPAEALPLFEKTLAITRKARGEEHADTAAAHNNLSTCLAALGKEDEAQALLEKALANARAAKASKATVTRIAVNVAIGYSSSRQYDKAAPLLEEAVAAAREELGEDHPWTARSSVVLASCLERCGKPDRALGLLRTALASHRRTLGEDHPHTADNYDQLAACLWNQGRHAEAVRLLQQAQPGREAARYHRAATGFERAQAGSSSGLLAVGLARLGQPGNAFAAAEASLARGLLDDLTSASPEAAKVFALKARLGKLDRQLASFASQRDLSASEREQHGEVIREHRRTSSDLARLAGEASAAGVLPLTRIQKQIASDAALVLWIDAGSVQEHWACVVRRQGAPAWLRLAGSGKGGAWTDDDLLLAVGLHAALSAPDSGAEQRQKLIAALRRQRLEPLLPRLKARDGLPAVSRLIVVPTGRMAFVPVEALAPEYRIHYAPSGSVLARLGERHRKLEASSLLALGDPAFDVPKKEPPVPPGTGVLLTRVQPGGNAEKAGLKAGDVLLSVGEVEIESADDLPKALKEVPAEAAYWRDGKSGKLKLEALPLGAAYDRRSPRAAYRAWRQAGATPFRGTGHKALPGTRREVEAVVALVGEKLSTALLGSDASEQELDRLAAGKGLKRFRLLHFATHGEIDWRSPDRSALVLAQDRLPDPVERARQGKKVYDGRLTVSAIRQWELDADLVVLSACNTGLGKEAGGDGLLGFSQAFLSRGARAVVLSRWPVDDAATALLMRRFYQNLLGKRQGLDKPLGRAEALREAKDWLRRLTPKEAEKQIESLPRGELVKAPKGQARPYEHPCYWAAFTLIGDPD